MLFKLWVIILHKLRGKSLKIKQILEAKYVNQKKGWLWVVKRDIEITLRGGRHDKHITMKFFNWAKDNKKTLNHLYLALQNNAQRAYEFLENNWGRPPTGEQLNFYWYGELDFTEFAVYQQLRKILHSTEELDYVARIMVDVVADEIKKDVSKFITEDFPKTRKRRVKRLPQQHRYLSGLDLNADKPTVLRNPKVKHLGSGSFASAYAHEDRPHDIRRISKPAVDPDAYLKYIEALKNNPDYDNPYFPQIHEVTKYTGDADSRGVQTVLSVKAGRLHRLDTLNNKEVHAVLERWFGENYSNVMKKMFHYDLQGISSYYLIPDVVRKLIEKKRFRKEVVDQELLRAINFMDKEVLKKGVQSDIGVNNLMFRRSPSGIQIVLTDPVA